MAMNEIRTIYNRLSGIDDTISKFSVSKSSDELDTVLAKLGEIFISLEDLKSRVKAVETTEVPVIPDQSDRVSAIEARVSAIEDKLVSIDDKLVSNRSGNGKKSTKE